MKTVIEIWAENVVDFKDNDLQNYGYAIEPEHKQDVIMVLDRLVYVSGGDNIYMPFYGKLQVISKTYNLEEDSYWIVVCQDD